METFKQSKGRGDRGRVSQHLSCINNNFDIKETNFSRVKVQLRSWHMTDLGAMMNTLVKSSKM